MKENQIKLNQIVTQKEMRQKKRGSLHALNNSFKRNTLISSESANKYESSYQCKLPETNFNRRDLSIILRYILFKQQMQLSDRNLLRRILLGIFDEELISAGTKKFVHFLKLEEGSRIFLQEESHFYFILKGKGTISSGAFAYNIKEGDTFGHVQILSQQKINRIQFQSKYILLKLQKKHFNEYFRKFYQKIYQQKENQLQCIKQYFLDKIPLLNKYLFLNKIQYKKFSSGEKIVIQGQTLKQLYFLNNNANVDAVPSNCIGLYEVLRQRNTVRETIYCNQKIILPYVDLDIFTQYVIGNSNSFLMNQSSAFDKFRNKTSSFQIPERVNNFMKIKRVKLKLNRSRLKTDVGDFYQTNFKFFKLQNVSLNPQKMLRQSKPLTNKKGERYQRIKNYSLSKPLRNNYF